MAMERDVATPDNGARMPSLFREVRELFAIGENGHMSLLEMLMHSVGFGLIVLEILTSAFNNPARLADETGLMFWIAFTAGIVALCLVVSFAPRHYQTVFDNPKAGAATCVLNAASQLALLLMNVVPAPFDIAVSCIVGPLCGVTLGMMALFWARIFSFMYIPDIATCALISVAGALLLHVVVFSNLPDAVSYFVLALLPLLAAPLTHRLASEHTTFPDIADNLTYYDRRDVWPLFVYKVGLPLFCVGLVVRVFLAYAHESRMYGLDLFHTLGLVVIVVIACVIANFGIYGVRRTIQSFARFLSVVVPLLSLVSIPLAPTAALGTAVVNMSLLASICLIVAMSWTHMASATLEYAYTSTSTFGLGIGSFVLGVVAASPILVWVPNDSPLFAVAMGAVCLLMAFGFLPPRPAPTLERSSYAGCGLEGAAGAGDADTQVAQRGGATGIGVRAEVKAQAARKAALASALQGGAGRGVDAGSGLGLGLASGASGTGTGDMGGFGAAGSDAGTGESDASEVRGKGRFIRRCESIAKMYLLSARETEVLILLAKGRGMNHIREELVISEGTAKTHISHVYKKLDVHSRHELIELIESID